MAAVAKPLRLWAAEVALFECFALLLCGVKVPCCCVLLCVRMLGL